MYLVWVNRKWDFNDRPLFVNVVVNSFLTVYIISVRIASFIYYIWSTFVIETDMSLQIIITLGRHRVGSTLEN